MISIATCFFFSLASRKTLGTNPGSLRGGILPGCGEGRKNLRCRGAESALPAVCSRNANWNDDQACVVEVDVLGPHAKVLSVHSDQRAEQLAVCCVGTVVLPSQVCPCIPLAPTHELCWPGTNLESSQGSLRGPRTPQPILLCETAPAIVGLN
jgi:hypothetical protein